MTTTSGLPTLVWSSQCAVLPTSSTPFLKGDKIILPPSALEQLLSAATVTVSHGGPPRTSNFDPYNPYSFAAERQARAETTERQQQLPHPLTFRLVNPRNGRIVFAGIREFSAGDNQVGLSEFLRRALGLEEENDGANDSDTAEAGASTSEESRITIHVKELPKGTYVKLRPLEAGYDPEDWKALLEKYLRDNFTTLTNGEILSVPAGKEEFRFLVDGLKPNSEAVSLVDTDLEVDIEALNEEQARETLKQRLEKSRRAPGTVEGSSPGGLLELGTDERGQVRPGEYVDYTIEDWDRECGVEFELTLQDDGRDVDMFMTPHGPRQRSRPRQDEHVFGDFSSRPTKKIRISATNVELDGSVALWVSVRGCEKPNGEEGAGAQQAPIPYLFRAVSIIDSSMANGDDMNLDDAFSSNPDEDRCKNCHQWVPRRTMILHENFCFRNNIFCSRCENVFKKTSTEWKSHWHCPHDDAFGNTQPSRDKHDSLFHTALSCPACSHRATDTLTLAHHRTTTCPGKPILCAFCHLEVAQQGPDDLDLSDPEVILSGLTPHELSDGARTTECHLCAKIVRLRDMSTHLKHHDIQRLSRPTPRVCRNANCGRTVDGVGQKGDIRHQAPRNELGACDTCFGPLYVSMYDPEGKALRRRVERKYLTQLLTGCGKPWCRNEFCKSGRKALGGLDRPGGLPITSKEAMAMVKPLLPERLREGNTPVYFCVDEASQQRRSLAELLAAEAGGEGPTGGTAAKGKGRAEGEVRARYELEWCVAALEAESGDLDRGRAWLRDWAPTRAETGR
ncbi:hypothetical protein MMC07_005366 [Pseudocyphellaria aurata]|nr:hypothetical protein [Pseudocyphellaria aurata]